MRNQFTLYLVSLMMLITTFVCAQSVQLSFPINRSVIQRDGSNLGQATITIAGQVTGGSANAQEYQVKYRTSTLNANGGITSTSGWTALSIQTTGLFYATPTFNKGWYLLEIGVGFNPAVTASAKFGVGDVYVIAGQSNAQGVLDGGTWNVPSTSGFPEWIVSVNLDWVCKKEYPDAPTFNTLTGLNRISPTGNNSWCYAVLGKKISDANNGMPVAFFNAAYGGSTILNWAQSSQNQLTDNAYPYVNSQYPQYCLINDPSKGTEYYRGEPYRALKNTLNYYSSLFGVRAVLWHQGETDADPNATLSLRTTDTQTYKDRLQQVISQTRSDFSYSLSWMIARATFNNSGNITTSILQAQGDKGSESDKNVGPLTDYVSDVATGTTTGSYRSDGTHFNENSNAGLTFLANKWDGKINVSSPGPAGFNYVTANPIPYVSISKSGSNRIVSVQGVSGAQEYRWGNNINSPTQSGPTLTSITVPTSSGSLRCYIKDGTGNWRMSPLLYFSCPSCRDGANELENDFGVALNVYPNPFIKELTVEFDVAQSDSDVLLEIINNKGQVVKTLANGSHAKGHWTYPVQNLTTQANQHYFCRLKVGNIFTVKKLLQVN